MQDYQSIKNYLSNFDKDTTVGTLISSLEEEKKKDTKKYEEMEANVGKYYYYRDDDDEQAFQFFYKIEGIKNFECGPLYTTTTIEICPESIYYEKDFTVTEREISKSTLIDESKFNEVTQMFNSFVNYRP